MIWRVIDEPVAREGSWNMAVDEALFQAIETGDETRPVLRLYTWSPACLSLGYHQEFETACHEGYLASRGFSVVRRPTGGRAVLHDDELTYAVIAPTGELFPGGLAESYARIAEALAKSLAGLGLRVELEERAAAITPNGAAPCFLVPSTKEILVEGKKVVGSAQVRGKRAFLQHGAIPLKLDYEALASATRHGPQEAATYRLAFAGLSDFIPRLSTARLRKALRSGFAEVFPGEWQESGLNPGEAEEAKRLHEHKYSKDHWNRRRTPC
ncbi:MAG: lipoate--protein ligase family protein [Acidobacteria bacterium]|nr:lipoate--protein ligase family protein [Acidobacteriota bacterium]